MAVYERGVSEQRLWTDVYHRPVVQLRMRAYHEQYKGMVGRGSEREVVEVSMVTVSQPWWEEEEEEDEEEEEEEEDEEEEEEVVVGEEGGEGEEESEGSAAQQRWFPYPAAAVNLLQEPANFAAMRAEALAALGSIIATTSSTGEDNVEVSTVGGGAMGSGAMGGGAVGGTACWGGQSESLHTAGDWSVMQLFVPSLAVHSSTGMRGWTDCARRVCPQVVRVLQELHTLTPARAAGGGWRTGYEVQDAWLSLVRADTFIAPHCGLTDTRLRIHIPLVVVSSTNTSYWLRVGHRSKCYREGHALVFDDAFEHEVQQRHGACEMKDPMETHRQCSIQLPPEQEDQELDPTDQARGWRLVLVVDLWHPHATSE
jgi:hypothetical protein